MSATHQPVPSATKPPGGVLPVPVTATQTPQANGTTKTPAKSNASRLKVIIRRLPPGITESEVTSVLGEEWTLGKGKVDWLSFKPGKVSKDLAKPSRPARLYLQVTNAGHLDLLAEKLQTATFADARNTGSDPVLLGPPNLEFAPFQRTPAKRRNDARQGTIDQDPEFMEFLESLINPITKPETSSEKVEAAVTTTPLIQHLREKKAAKEAAKQKKEKEKSAKQAEQNTKDGTADKKADAVNPAQTQKGSTPAALKKGGRGGKSEKAAAQPANAASPRVAKKENPTAGRAQKPASSAAAPSAQAAPATPVTTPAAPATARKADAINPAAAAARMLQRDLGLRGGRGGTLGRRARQGQEPAHSGTAATTIPTAPGNAPSSPAAAPAKPAASTTPAAAANPPSSPAIMRRGPGQSSNTPGAVNNRPAAKPATAPGQTAQPQPTQQPQPTRHVPMPASGHGFLKHANPSQGITEPLLEVALGVFGKVVKVEIDKRKGFAYVEYAEPAELQKAIAASPIKVAQGAVQVQEKKDRGAQARPVAQPVVQPPPPLPRGPQAMMGRGNVPVGPAAFRGGRGGIAAGRGRGGAMAPVSPANPSVSVPTAPAAAPTSAAVTATPATTTSVPDTPSSNLAANVQAAAPAKTAEAPAVDAHAGDSKPDATGVETTDTG